MTKRLDYAKAAPEALKAMIGLEGHVRRSGLDHNLIDLVYLRVSQINGCAYCIDMHSHELRQRGETEQRLAMVAVSAEATELFSERERAALAWAEEVTLLATGHVHDAAYAAVSKHFEGKELAELTVAIGMINAWNRLGVSFRMEVKPRAATAPGKP